MAEEKKGKDDKGGKKDGKDAKKPSGGGGGSTLPQPKSLTEFVAYMFIIIVAILAAVKLFERIALFLSTFFNNRGYATGSAETNEFLNSLFYLLGAVALYFTIISNIVSVFLLMGLIYALIRLTELNKAEEERINHAPTAVTSGAPGFKLWERITDNINTDNPSDWRLAILEADIILDELLTKIGTVGASMGDKLKQVEKSDFTTIESAWEAHKVRNMIAHEGQEFLLSKREAQRVIRLYEEVFREFHLI